MINENNIGDRERFDKEYLKIIDLINKEEFNQVQIILDNYNLKDYALWNYVYALFRHEQGWMNDAYGHYKEHTSLNRITEFIIRPMLIYLKCVTITLIKNISGI